MRGIEIPKSVEIGPGLVLQHRGQGIVMSPNVRLGRNVQIFHQVTLGVRDLRPGEALPRFAVDIEDGCKIYPGAKIIGGPRPTVLARGTTVGPNSVVTSSSSPNQVLSGIPARPLTSRGSQS
jgi:serine O-acetyltransferase